MDFDLLYEWGVAIVMIGAVASLVLLLVVDAPYGRHMRAGWGPSVRSRFGWVAMELPSPVAFMIAYMGGDHAREPAALVLMLCFQLHYLNRTLIYPMRMRAGARPNAALTVSAAILFNALNGWLCGYAISQRVDLGPYGHLAPHFVAGIALFAIGAAINLHSDAILRRLRRPNESGYRIPHGGLYRWISCPNYLGEIVEWLGWALAGWSSAGLAFALFTIANLAPRARANQRWYRDQFPDYPAKRSALLPLLW